MLPVFFVGSLLRRAHSGARCFSVPMPGLAPRPITVAPFQGVNLAGAECVKALDPEGTIGSKRKVVSRNCGIRAPFIMHAFISLLKAFSIVSLFLALTAGIYIALNSGDLPPPDVSDLQVPYPNVPDEENAYTLYAEAAPALDIEDEVLDAIQSDPGESFEDPQAVEELLKRFDVPLEKMAKGARRERCIFPRPDAIDTMLPSVTGFLTAGQLWKAEVQVALERGELERAEASARNLLLFGQSVITEPETLIQYLIGNALLAYGFEAFELVVTHPKVTPETLKEMRHLLAMEDLLNEALSQAMKAEYNFFNIAMKSLTDMPEQEFGSDVIFDHVFARFFPGFFLKPNATRAVFAEYFRTSVSNVGKPYSDMTFGQAEQILSEVEHVRRFPPPPNFGGILLMRILLPAVDGVLLRYSELLGHSRALKTLIALRLYEKEHEELPSTLSGLLPGFLQEVPRDPFDGQPLRYDPERRIVWSVGEDLIDQNGSTVQREGTRRDERRNQEDLVWEMGW